jgi:hypothetical protein
VSKVNFGKHKPLVQIGWISTKKLKRRRRI